MRREYRGRFPRHRLQSKLPVIDPGMHHGTWVTRRDACRDRLPALAGKTLPAFPAHAQPAIFVAPSDKRLWCDWQ